MALIFDFFCFSLFFASVVQSQLQHFLYCDKTFPDQTFQLDQHQTGEVYVICTNECHTCELQCEEQTCGRARVTVHSAAHSTIIHCKQGACLRDKNFACTKSQAPIVGSELNVLSFKTSKYTNCLLECSNIESCGRGINFNCTSDTCVCTGDSCNIVDIIDPRLLPQGNATHGTGWTTTYYGQTPAGSNPQVVVVSGASTSDNDTSTLIVVGIIISVIIICIVLICGGVLCAGLVHNSQTIEKSMRSLRSMQSMNSCNAPNGNVRNNSNQRTPNNIAGSNHVNNDTNGQTQIVYKDKDIYSNDDNDEDDVETGNTQYKPLQVDN